MRFSTLLFLLFAFSVPALADSPTGNLVSDDYTAAKHETRKALRGDWKIENGVASVMQDDETYKKFANHGPIMVYEVSHKDAVAEVTFKPTGCKAVVFTMDAKDGGHAFRVKLSQSTPGTVMTYIKKPGDEKAKPVFLSKKLPVLKENEWATLKVRVVGEKATVQMGDTTVEIQHAKIDQEKKIAKLGFSFGSLQIKKFDLATAK
ncbi:MAG: hypothetical protein WBD20_17800 [Pirellulaceae bacterium]